MPAWQHAPSGQVNPGNLHWSAESDYGFIVPLVGLRGRREYSAHKRQTSNSRCYFELLHFLPLAPKSWSCQPWLYQPVAEATGRFQPYEGIPKPVVTEVGIRPYIPVLDPLAVRTKVLGTDRAGSFDRMRSLWLDRNGTDYGLQRMETGIGFQKLTEQRKARTIPHKIVPGRNG